MLSLISSASAKDWLNPLSYNLLSVKGIGTSIAFGLHSFYRTYTTAP